MKRQSELKGVIEDLKRHLEFEKSMGVARVPIEKKAKEETVPKAPEKEPVRTKAKAQLKTEARDNVIRIEEQIDIFDASAKKMTLEEIRAEIGDWTRCKRHEGRTNLVFGDGNPKARLVFVGEGPGRDEDLQGKPFVGRSGQLLTKIIEAMGLKREDVYICNVVKCSPPENRTPEPG